MSLLRDNWFQVLTSLLLICMTEISRDKVGFRVNTDVGYLQYSHTSKPTAIAIVLYGIFSRHTTNTLMTAS